MALALVALFAGLWGGLLRLGLEVPTDVVNAMVVHGPLMTFGFLGTLISLERAVALGRAFAYAAPLGAGSGALLALVQAPGSLGPALILFAGLVLVCAHAVIQRIQPSAHNLVMGAGALAWCAAAAMWLAGQDVAAFAPLLAGYLVATIVGERLELTRTLPRSRRQRAVLVGAIVVFGGGLALSIAQERLGMRIAGAGLAAQALWLMLFDVARRTVRGFGLTRFMAFALLAGYLWLLVAGVVWILDAPTSDGFAYDAALHAVFLGFVISMVFAHAGVIIPAVLRVPLRYSPLFYAHLLLLHISLALRLIGGDLAGNLTCWQWGGIGNEAAILLFIALSAHAALRAGRARGRPQPRRSHKLASAGADP